MMTITRFLIIIGISSALISFWEIKGLSDSLAPSVTPSAPFSKMLVERQKKRVALEEINMVCKALEIKKNMVILDIGTGSGLYAYKFSKVLQGTGEVFATDINPDAINYVKAQVNIRHLKNVTPVLVRADGVDNFYGLHRYDLIFLAHVLDFIPDKKSFLSAMRNYLKPHGHLFLLTYKYFDNFNIQSITDVKGLLAKVLTLDPKSPFYRYLGPLQSQARKIIEGGPLTGDFESEIIRRFNDMARDPHFFVPFLDDKEMELKDSLTILPQERLFINLNLSFFKEYNIEDKQRGIDLKSSHLNHVNIFIMNMINKILIISQFQEFLFNGYSPYLPGGDIIYQIVRHKDQFKAFGYRFDRSFDFIPNEILMEFSSERS